MPRGVITFVFDDGYKRVYELVLPLLRSFNLPAVFALPIDGAKLQRTEQRAVKPWPEWLPIQKEGHEIASHSISHPNLKNISDEALETELRESAKILDASTIVYPGGAFDERVIKTAAQYYTAGRTVLYGFETLPPRMPLALQSYNFSKNNFSVVRANTLALWACITGRWLIETYHMIDDKESAMVHSVVRNDLKQHMGFVKRLPVAVKTIRSVMETYR